MENATKALIIAAAVLIAIVLIGLGVRILSASNDSSAQVDQTASQLSGTTDNAIKSINGTLTNLSL